MKTRRRFPWLTAEDMKILAQLPPRAAQKFERSLDQDRRAHERDALSRVDQPAERRG